MSEFDELINDQKPKQVAPVPSPVNEQDLDRLRPQEEYVTRTSRRADWRAGGGRYDPDERDTYRAREGVNPVWLALLSFTAVTFAILWISTWIPVPGPHPNVDPVDGTYVAIFYQDTDKKDYTDDQRAAMDSAAIAQFLDANVTDWKKIDVDDLNDLKGLNPVYSEMADSHMPRLPWISIRTGRQLLGEEISSGDDVMKLVKRAVK